MIRLFDGPDMHQVRILLPRTSINIVYCYMYSLVSQVCMYKTCTYYYDNVRTRICPKTSQGLMMHSYTYASKCENNNKPGPYWSRMSKGRHRHKPSRRPSATVVLVLVTSCPLSSPIITPPYPPGNPPDNFQSSIKHLENRELSLCGSSMAQKKMTIKRAESREQLPPPLLPLAVSPPPPPLLLLTCAHQHCYTQNSKYYGK